MRALKLGIPRLSLVERFLDSDESKRLDSSWRDAVYKSGVKLSGSDRRPEGVVSRTLRSKLAVRMYDAFRTLRNPGIRQTRDLAHSPETRIHKFLNYLTYWLYLPITIHDSFANAGNLSGPVAEYQELISAQKMELDSVQKRLDETWASLSELRDTTVAKLEDLGGATGALAQSVQGLSQNNKALLERSLETLANLAGYVRELPRIAGDQKSLADWMNLLQRKMESLALDMHELGAGHQAEIAQPEIVNRALYCQKLEEMGGLVRVNLGCGERPLAGYLNVDCRRIPEVDIVADVRRLPFTPRSLVEICSSHLIEHFPSYHLRKVLLPYWKSLLRDGGILRTICPNWRAMIERLNRGDMSLDEFHLVTFGGQEYDADAHFAMYTPETLSAVLTDTGFRNIRIVVTQRQNGLCPEMEIVAEA